MAFPPLQPKAETQALSTACLLSHSPPQALFQQGWQAIRGSQLDLTPGPFLSYLALRRHRWPQN